MSRRKGKSVDGMYVGKEPTYNFDVELTKMDLIKAFNWYNYSKPLKERQKYTIRYLKKVGVDTTLVEKYIDKLPSSVHSISRLIDNGYLIDDETRTRWSEHIGNLKEIKESSNDNKKVVKKEVDRFPFFMEEIEDRILFETKFNLYQYLLTFKVPKIFGERIKEYIKPMYDELKEAYRGKDKDLKEAYSHLGKVGLKREIKRFETFFDDIDRYCATKVRKPRKRKIKPATALIEKLQYKSNDMDLKVTSIDPTLIIGANVLWVLNTKYGRVTKYVANDGGLSVKGTTIQNFNDKESESKNCGRTIKGVVEVVTGKSKVARRKVFKEIRTKNLEVNGRIGKDTLLLRIEK